MDMYGLYMCMDWEMYMCMENMYGNSKLQFTFKFTAYCSEAVCTRACTWLYFAADDADR